MQTKQKKMGKSVGRNQFSENQIGDILKKRVQIFENERSGWDRYLKRKHNILRKKFYLK